MAARVRLTLLVALVVVASATVGGVAGASQPTSIAESAQSLDTGESAQSPDTGESAQPSSTTPLTPPSTPTALSASQQPNESVCSFDNPSWRAPQLLAGVRLQGERACRPDNPNVVAASVLGTNNVPGSVLNRSGLSRDAVVKRNDTDGDGDPDVVHVTLEVMGINEHNPALTREAAPGVSPTFWVFAPKTRGIVTDGWPASRLVRMPSPPIRVEAGDRLLVTLENTHYAPHAMQFGGVDRTVRSNASGDAGTPLTGADPVLPGESRTYELTPEEPGTYAYRDHTASPVGPRMGLSGMLVVTANRSNNHVQTLNVGGGKVRHPSKAATADHDAIYDFQYQGIDAELHEIPKRYDDVRRILEATNREYDATNASMDYYLLNGRSFPYTLRESVVAVEPNASYQLRVLNAGSDTVSLRANGHDVVSDSTTDTDAESADGAPVFDSGGDGDGDVGPGNVVTLPAAGSTDFTLNTTAGDSAGSGDGIWLLSDTRTETATNAGVGPGGFVTAIAYDGSLQADGIPETDANLTRYFDPAYYDGDVPIWGHLDRDAFGDPPADDTGDGNGDSDARQAPSEPGFLAGVPDAVLFAGSVLGGALLVGLGVALGRWSR